jgi:hypothetical protein
MQTDYGSGDQQTGLRLPKVDGDVGCDLVVGGGGMQTAADRLFSKLCGTRVWILWPFWPARPLPSWGASVRLPRGEWALVLPRSSSAKRRVNVTPGVIDTGYTGPLYAVVRAVGLWPVVVREGERLAQIVRMPAIYPATGGDLESRGARGFGSTGF